MGTDAIQLVDIPPSLMRPDLKRRLPVSKRFMDITGKKYLRCRVVGLAGFLKQYPTWLCRCQCGRLFLCRANCLESQHIQVTCGCTRKTHGLSRTYFQHILFGMIRRCYDEDDPGYRHYGGRGITVCKRWRNSLADFAADMGPRPSNKHSIDRYPDNNGGYRPGNCRWATAKEQSWNSRRPRMFTLDGITQPLSAWAERLGMTRERMRQRVDTCLANGVDVSEALTTPFGETMPSFLERCGKGRPRKIAAA